MLLSQVLSADVHAMNLKLCVNKEVKHKLPCGPNFALQVADENIQLSFVEICMSL